MGYTHYFKQNKPVSEQQWKAFQADAEVILKHVQDNFGIVLMTNDDKTVLIDSERVNLNGDERQGLDHETFFLEKDYREFNFCKTARKPYDLAVCALLLLAHEHMKEHHDIGSDGSFEEWQEAMQLNADVLGRAYKLPERIDSSEEVQEFEQELAQQCSQKKANESVAPVETLKDIQPKKKSSRYNL